MSDRLATHDKLHEAQTGSPPERQLTSHLKLYQRAWDLKDSLEAWRNDYETHFATTPIWAEPSTVAGPSMHADLFSDQAFNFLAARNAHDHLCYSVAMVYIYDILDTEYKAISTVLCPTQLLARSIRPLEYHATTQQPLGAWLHARRICESMEYFWRRNKRIFGPAIAFYSMRVVSDFFKRAKADIEVEWCQWAMQELSNRCIPLSKEVRKVIIAKPHEQPYHTVGICYGGWV